MTEYHKYLDKVVKITRKLLGKDPLTIFEMGALDCAETLAFNRFFPKAVIYTFECNPDTLPTCKDRVKDIRNITLIEKAVSDREGSIDFYKTVGTKGLGEIVNHGISSILQINDEHDLKNYQQAKINVPSTTIRNVCIEKNIDMIDLLWIDTQGAELLALKGAAEYLRRIKIINIEVEFYEQYKDEPLFSDIKKFLNDNGFRLYTFSNLCKSVGDAVFINKNLVKRRFLLPESSIIFCFKAYEKITGKLRRIKNDMLIKR